MNRGRDQAGRETNFEKFWNQIRQFHLLQSYNISKNGLAAFQIYGTPGRIRTYDLRIRSPLLYPAELQAHAFNSGQASCSNFEKNFCVHGKQFSRRIR